MKSNAHIRKFIHTRTPTKTGQDIQYQVGDDGYNEFGWWLGRYNVDNKTRFIEKTINGDKVVLDFATGLMFPKEHNQAGCNNGAIITWGNAITYAESLSFAGFSDWHITNIKQLLSLICYDAGITPNLIPVPFTDFSDIVWSSTTLPSNTTHALQVNTSDGKIVSAVKTSSHYIRTVRLL